MEIIRKSPGKVYYKSSTSVAIKLLAFLAVVLVLLVLGVCIFVIFGFGNAKNYFLDATQTFYYSVNNDAKTARYELYVGKDATVTIPETVNHRGDTYRVTEIGAQSFTNNKKLSSVTVANSVERIVGNTTQATGAFSGCINLTTVKFGDNVRHIDNYAFKNCLKLPTVDLPATLQFVGVGAFMNNLALTTIKLNGGNTRLDGDSFKYCEKVTTLAIGNEVILDNDKKHALASLSNLTIFELADDNTRYQVVDNCVLNTAGDTLVIGGKRDTAMSFSGIDKIEDWAFGKRYGSNDIFVPDNVTTVEEHAFSAGIVYTNNASKPESWQTKLPVRCGAQKVTFKRNYNNTDAASAVAFTFTTDPDDTNHYHEQNGIFYPNFETLFGEADGEHVFKEWGAVNGGECKAEYENDALATSTDLTALHDVIQEADGHLSDKNTRLGFTLSFWEDFKAAYGVAKSVYAKGSAAALGYEVEKATTNLQYYLDQIDQPTAVIKVDVNDWRTGLQDLMAVVEIAIDNQDDFVDDPDVWGELKSVYNHEAKNCLADEECDITKGVSAWRILRGHYEELVVAVATDDAETPLSKLINECADLNAEKYTTESWEKFMNALNQARSITEYNMSVSQVRLALQAAKDGLVENNLASYEQLVELAAWLSVCSDLKESDYTQTSYDKMVIAWQRVYDKLATTDTVTEVQSAVNTLRNNYNALIAVNKEPTEAGNSTMAGNLAPYFIVALVLFTIAIVIQAVASSLKKGQRSKNHE